MNTIIIYMMLRCNEYFSCVVFVINIYAALIAQQASNKSLWGGRGSNLDSRNGEFLRKNFGYGHVPWIRIQCGVLVWTPLPFQPWSRNGSQSVFVPLAFLVTNSLGKLVPSELEPSWGRQVIRALLQNLNIVPVISKKWHGKDFYRLMAWCMYGHVLWRTRSNGSWWSTRNAQRRPLTSIYEYMHI